MLQAKDRAGHKLSKANIWDCNKYKYRHKYRYRKGIEILLQIQIRLQVRKGKGQGCALAGSGKQRCECVENLGELASCIGCTNRTTSILQCMYMSVRACEWTYVSHGFSPKGASLAVR